MDGEGENKVKAAFALCFLALAALMGTSAMVAWRADHLAQKNPVQAFCPDVPPVSSFRGMYPFEEKETTASSDAPAPVRANGILSQYCHLIVSRYCHVMYDKRQTIERYTSRKTIGFTACCRLVAGMDEALGIDLIENGESPIVRLPNGYLCYVYPCRDESASWKELQELNLWLKERHIPLLQLLPATKQDDSITVFPRGIPHAYSRMIEQYKGFLADNHIPCLDATKVLLAENADFFSWFYRTDHHWNVFAARLVAEATAKRLNDDFKIPADVGAIDESRFALAVYPSSFSGSMALKAATSPEDFQIFYQRANSLFHVKVPCMGLDRTGGFNDTLIAKPYLKSGYSYCAFLYGDQPLLQIENTTCPNNTRLLVIKHSQADVLCPYLACAVRHLDIIDPRHFDGNPRAFIEETRPDIVIVCI